MLALRSSMATKKTSIFTLTERITITAADTETFATISLGSYVDVADRQALQVHSVDYIFQSKTPSGEINGAMGANGTIHCQVTDLNRGGLVFADDRALVSSAQLVLDTDGFLATSSDLFPDNFGKGSDDGRFVVNDELYITALSSALGTGLQNEINVTVRVNASIVSLSAKDFMSIAIASTAADN